MKESTDYSAGGDAVDLPLIDRQLLSARNHTALFANAEEAAEEFAKVAAYLRDHTARRTRPGPALWYLYALGQAHFQTLKYGAAVQGPLLRVLVALGPLADLELTQIEAKKRRGTRSAEAENPAGQGVAGR